MPRGRALLAIDELTSRQGERIAIVGHNGAGKSTLLRLLTGFMPAAHGTVEVLGRALEEPSRRPMNCAPCAAKSARSTRACIW
jgi:ABC-type cobalamin/Fe3+-siderophores transport system ATPase subunit